MKNLSLTAQIDYQKVYYLLKDNAISESLISMLRKDCKSMKINGKYVDMRSKIYSGQTLQLTFREQAASNIPPSNMPLDILYEDEDFLIINKPAFLPSIPSKRHYQNNIANAVVGYMQKYARPFVYRVLGRLDKDTSGVLIVAKNPVAASMSSFEKAYLALCHGNFDKTQFDVEKPIRTIQTDGINQQRRVVDEDGKPAKTHVEVLKQNQNVALVKLTLSHGRTHQIRVHLSCINHPLLGDKVYGIQDDAPRTMLHCAEVKLVPPFSANKICVSAPLPKDFSDHLI